MVKQFLYGAVFYAILDTGYVSRSDAFCKCSQILKSGTRIVQLRAKKESRDERRSIALEILPLFKESNAKLIINDDALLAAELNLGLHIGQDDLSPEEARKLRGHDSILGLSTHSIEQAKKADNIPELLDYFAVGPVYATQTKPGRPAVGLELVSKVAAMNPKLPWFAIGGINSRTARDVWRAGAKRIVAVSDVLSPDDTCKAILNLTKSFLGESE